MQIENLQCDILGVFDGICYVTDRDGIIQSIGSANWNKFASENGAASLTADSVIDRSVLDFIDGDEIRNAFRDILKTMLTSDNTSWVMPYRCSSPGTIRNMRLSIKPVRDRNVVQGFLFQSILLTEEMRPPLDLFDFEAVSTHLNSRRELPLVVICAWCQNIKQEEDNRIEWIEAEEFYRRGGTSNVNLTHSICDSCRSCSEDGFVRHGPARN